VNDVKLSRFTRRPLYRRAITVFCGVMAVVFALQCVGQIRLTDPATAAELGLPLGDTRLAFLRAGMSLILVVMAVLHHYEHPDSLLFALAGLLMLLAAGGSLVREEATDALLNVACSFGMLIAARLTHEAEDT